jgi:2'-5' RNA ligase
MEQVRSFIAIELPDELRLELGRLQARLRVDRPRVKWVDPSGIHLTLKFLGNIPVASIEPVTQALTESASKVSPFQLTIQQLGAFPNLRRVQVVWVGLGGELDKVNELYRLIEASLSHLGFTAEQRPFAPHLTLARLSNEALPDEQQRFGELIAGTSFESREVIRVNSINLMRSQLTSQGAIYSKISSAELKKNN